MERRPVGFMSDGLELVGELYLPDRDAPYPTIVLTTSFSAVKEQISATYARQLAQRGVAALAFDHRGWGQSEGEPRNHEDAAGKARDLTDALSFLATLPEVDPERRGMCGVRLGAVYATQVAAFDRRVGALAPIGGSYNEPAVIRWRFGSTDSYRRLMAEFADISKRQYESGDIEYWPAINPDGIRAGTPGPEPAEYYGTARGAHPHWENRCTALSVKEELTISIQPALSMLSPTPLLVVHGSGDGAVPPEDAQAAFETVRGPKKLVWVDATNHVDLYDREPLVQRAADVAAEWFERYLGEQGAHAAGAAAELAA